MEAVRNLVSLPTHSGVLARLHIIKRRHYCSVAMRTACRWLESNQFPQFNASADLTTTRTSANTERARDLASGGEKRSVGEVFLSLLDF